MQLQSDFDLVHHNTFRVSAQARHLVQINNTDELNNLMAENTLIKPLLILGGGSNLLLVDDFPGTVILNKIMGINLTHEDDDYIYLSVGAGENWHNFVMHTLACNWFGLENLSLIPGTVGAAPVQNIGAYGVDVSHFIDAVSVYNIEKCNVVHFSYDMCHFGYRDSIFKRQYQVNDQSQNWPSASLLITHVHFKLLKKPKVNVTYRPINDEITRLGITMPHPRQIADIVIAIRQSKLPDPDLIPNAGSFFKNPIIPKAHYDMLILAFPELISFHHSSTHIKLAAGQLIELSGFKGKKIGNASMYAKQALVLTNCGNATGRELWEYANLVSAEVLRKFSVNLTPEPLILMNPPL